MKKVFSFFVLSLLLTGCLQSSTLSEADRELSASILSDGFSRESVEINYDESYLAFTGTKNSFSASHQGEFENFTVDIDLDDEDPTALERATFTVNIDITSMKTENDSVTGHLLTPDYFESETYPTAQFVSSSISAAKGENAYSITGDLTIKDVTKEVVFDAVIANDVATMNLTIDRMDFNVGEANHVDNEVPLEAKLVFF